MWTDKAVQGERGGRGDGAYGDDELSETQVMIFTARAKNIYA